MDGVGRIPSLSGGKGTSVEDVPGFRFEWGWAVIERRAVKW